VLIGHRHGDLRFDLDELVLHVENELAGELLGVLSFGEEVVDIRAEQSSDTFE
jgi:hypothetical protein